VDSGISIVVEYESDLRVIQELFDGVDVRC